MLAKVALGAAMDYSASTMSNGREAGGYASGIEKTKAQGLAKSTSCVLETLRLRSNGCCRVV